MVSPQARRSRERHELIAALDLRPEWQLATETPSEPELLRNLIASHHKVVCIGAYGSPSRDPSPAYITHLVESGHTTLVDIQDPKDRTPTILEKLNKRKAELVSSDRLVPSQVERTIKTLSADIPNVAYKGGLTTFRVEVKRLRAQENEQVGTVKLRAAPAWDTGLRRNSHHLVVDRGTWEFLLSKGTPGNLTFEPDLLEKAIDHYLYILRPGGKIVFFVKEDKLLHADKTHSMLVNVLADRINHGQIHVSEFSLSPFSSDPATPSLYRFSLYQYRKAFVATKLLTN